MAINGTNKKKKAAGISPTSSLSPFRRHRSAQPPPFTAQGRGYVNRLPDYPADASNANATLVNKATGIHDLYRIYLFVDAVETGWKLSGETVQTQNSRSFYPRNLAQDELIIEGTVVNQYEYDRLVQFVLHHHHSQFTNSILNTATLDGNNGYPGVDFSLFRPTNSTLNTFSPMKFMVAITDIQAGAQKFKMVGIPYQLTCKVTYDYLQRQVDVEDEISTRISFQQVFGSAKNPDMTSAGTATDSSITTGAQKSTPAPIVSNPGNDFNETTTISVTGP